MALLGLKIKGQWMWWSQVRRHINQQEEYNLLKQASAEELQKLIDSHREELSKLRKELNEENSKAANLQSKVERLQVEAAAAEKKISERDVLTRNLADENSELRERNRDLIARINTLSGQNAKMKKQIDSLPQRGENGRFVKKNTGKKTSDSELNIKPVEVGQTPTKR